MNVLRSKSVLIVAVVAIAIVALAACAPAPTPTPVPPPPPTAVPPVPTTAPTTAPTAVPPTAAPAATATTAAGTKQYSVKVVSNATYGKFISDGGGFTLYMYPMDQKNVSNCYDDCAKRWPPFVGNAKPQALEGADAAMIGSFSRKDGTNQATYNGWPLYYWQNDNKPGDTLGYAVGNIWWVIAPDGGIISSTAPASLAVNLGAGRDGDQSGTATLRANGDKTVVTLNIKPGAAGVEQPVHIHEGACPGVGAVKFPLQNVVDGRSTTTVDASLASLLTGGFSINAHKSASEVGTYVACGGISQGSVLKLDKGRDADYSGSAILTAAGAKTDVYIFVKPQPPFANPAHIHEGSCPGVGAVKFPLTTTTQTGTSKTTVDASLADLLKGGFSINAHMSADEVGKYVACGAVK